MRAVISVSGRRRVITALQITAALSSHSCVKPKPLSLICGSSAFGFKVPESRVHLLAFFPPSPVDFGATRGQP